MAYYRCYFIDGASHVHDFAEFECGSDDDALARARHLRPSAVTDGFELWQQFRLVHREQRPAPCAELPLPPTALSLERPPEP